MIKLIAGAKIDFFLPRNHLFALRHSRRRERKMVSDRRVHRRRPVLPVLPQHGHRPPGQEEEPIDLRRGHDRLRCRRRLRHRVVRKDPAMEEREAAARGENRGARAAFVSFDLSRAFENQSETNPTRIFQPLFILRRS